MDTSLIVAGAMVMRQADVGVKVQTSLLRKTLDQSEQQIAQLFEALPTPDPSGQRGTQIDFYA